MQNAQFVQLLQPQHYLGVDVPDVVLLEKLSLALVLEYLLEEVPPVAVFHHDAKSPKSYHKDLEPES